MTRSDFKLPVPQPLLIVISGLSGVGKDSVLQTLKARGTPFHFVITTTTRSPRANEVHGRDYFFVSKEEFARMLENDEFFEHALVYQEDYGNTRKQVREALASGQDVIMRLDVQGAATVRKLAPQAVLIFLTTRNERELVERLKKRNSDAAVALNLRIATAHEELKHTGEFDYIVVNADCCLEETADDVIAIINAEHHRVNPRQVNL
jgi:guanylate kinase